MAIRTLFKSTIPSIRYFSRKGVECNFVNGRFHTTDDDVQEELTAEIGGGNSLLYVDSNEPTVDTEALSPYQLLVAEAKKQALAELAAEGALAPAAPAEEEPAAPAEPAPKQFQFNIANSSSAPQ